MAAAVQRSTASQDPPMGTEATLDHGRQGSAPALLVFSLQSCLCRTGNMLCLHWPAFVLHGTAPGGITGHRSFLSAAAARQLL